MMLDPVIYIVEDDDAVRDSLGLLFGIEGLSVRTFPSAQTFLDHLPSVRAGCIITDVHMPQMSGLELLRHLKAARADLPVILITGRTGVALAAEAMAAGVAAFIEKPFGPDEILTTVRAALTVDGPDLGG